MLEPGSTVWDLVERRAVATPDDVMVLDEHDRELTFAEFRQAAEEAAAGLLEAGVAPRSAVSWQMTTTIEAMVIMAALARIGATQNPILPVLRRREVGFIIEQTDAVAFVVPGVVRGFDHGALARELAAGTQLRPIVCGGQPAGSFGLALPAGDVGDLPEGPTDPDEVRWLYYTSGTTANPKGVKHTDRTVLAAGNAMLLVGGVGPRDTICAPIPITHIAGMMLLAVVLRSGCRLLVFEGFDPHATPQLVAKHGATIVGAVGPMFPAFFAAQQAKGTKPLLPRLRYFFSGGAPVPVTLHRQVRSELGGLGVAAPWGLTESPQATFPPLDADDDQLAGTTGRPVPGVEVRVADLDGRTCRTGGEGELRVRGPQRFVGYVDASLDDEALDADGFLRTGDVGSIDDDGFVRVTGRLKDVIIRNGENISAHEVEQILLGHPAVADAAVFGVPDEQTGERCCAAVQLTAEVGGLTVDEVRSHFDAVGAARQKVPERLELVASVPRNDLGKAQKHVLRERFTPEVASGAQP